MSSDPLHIRKPNKGFEQELTHLTKGKKKLDLFYLNNHDMNPKSSLKSGRSALNRNVCHVVVNSTQYMFNKKTH